MLLTRRAMLLRSALFGAALASGCGEHRQPFLRVGTAIWPGHEPLNIARELGYLSDTTHIVEYSATPEIHRSFQNKAIETACVTLDEALQLAQFETEIRVILAMNISTGADALLTRPEIQSLADLQGRRVGVQFNSVGTFILSRLLEKAGLTVGDITVVPITPAEAESTFTNNHVDAVITHEPFASRLAAAGAVTLFDSSSMPGEIMDVLVVRKETLDSQRESLIALVRAWFRSVEFCLKNRDRAVRIGAPHHEVSEPEFRRAFGRVDLLGAKRNRELFATPNGPLHDTVRKLAANMTKFQLLEKMVDPVTLLDATILSRSLS